MKKTACLLLIFLFGLTACRKYEDGPYISLTSKEKRVIGAWSTTINGVDLTLNFKEDKDFQEDAYNSEGEFFYSKNGHWAFDDNKENLLINASFSQTSAFYYFDENGNEVAFDPNGPLQIIQPEIQYKIYRLTKDAFWIGNATEVIYKLKKV